MLYVYRIERQEWKSDLVKKTKLRTYVMFKQSFEQEVYTNHVTYRAHRSRSVFARLRGYQHPYKLNEAGTKGYLQNKKLVVIILQKWVHGYFDHQMWLPQLNYILYLSKSLYLKYVLIRCKYSCNK